MEKYIANLGHELEVGNKVGFMTSGHYITGRIIGFENDKCVIQTTGCRYSTDEELKVIRKKAKRQYKIAPRRCYLLININK